MFGGQECVVVFVEGEDGVISDALEEVLQGHHSRFDELLIETVESLQAVLLRQRLSNRHQMMN